MKRLGVKLSVLSVLMTGILLTGCGNGEETVMSTQEAVQTESSEEAGEGLDEVQAQSASSEITSYLTGMPVSAEEQNQRPIAVMINNIEQGLPQAGIEQASVIYEAPVEGRITRLMGLFEDWKDIEKIGYVRSSRDYFVYCALEHDAIYCHFGQATPYVGDLLNSDKVDNISGAVAGIDKPAQEAYYRTDDRKAPYNVAATGQGILADVNRLGYSTEYHDTFKQKFVFQTEEDPYKDAPVVTEIYPGGQTSEKANGYSHVEAYFRYEDGKYYRYQYGGEHIDELTGNQLAYDNVILQYCHGEVRDENDYLAFRCHGDDQYPVQVFTDGKMIEGTWSRYGDNDPAVYVDSEGNPIQLSPGKTWVCIVWMEYAEDVELLAG